MKKIFISHSKLDQNIANELVKLLTDGMGVDSSCIFCSTLSGFDIPVGKNFNDGILEQIKNSDGFLTLPIISNEYYNSKYCLYELGVSWGLDDERKNIIPILVKGMNYANLSDFISHVQSVNSLDPHDINKLHDLILGDNKIYKKNNDHP